MDGWADLRAEAVNRRSGRALPESMKHVHLPIRQTLREIEVICAELAAGHFPFHLGHDALPLSNRS